LMLMGIGGLLMSMVTWHTCGSIDSFANL